MARTEEHLEYLSPVRVRALDPDRFESVLGPDRFREFQQLEEEGRRLFEGRVLWNVNSTAKGGGVAEMLASLIAYIRGAGLDARWVVIKGDPDFFRITKRIHNALHGQRGDGGPLGDEERRVYEDGLSPNAEEFARLVSEDDVVILHDPQTAGLAPAVRETGAAIVWRCHIGVDTPNDLARSGWKFLLPYLKEAQAYVFSRDAYVWEGLDRERVSIIPPSIDAFSPKNEELEAATVRAILRASGVTEDESDAEPSFVDVEGKRQLVKIPSRTDEGGPVPGGARIVAQVSRWDRLKDPVGVLRAFAEHAVDGADAHLVLAGPDVESVADDPEGAEALDEVRRAWGEAPSEAQKRTHVVCLPVEDAAENAIIVNALQRRADVVVQKSLAEGFGLTVAEAMWKARPVVASRVGGIQDQIEHEKTGLLVDDALDLATFGELVTRALNDQEMAERLGKAAQERVRAEFLAPRHLGQYVQLIENIL
jgi:trehalose synthase